jgi:DNA-binding NarL/FixJ family response regulator
MSEKEVQSRSRAEEAAGSVDVGALYAKLRSHLEPPTCVSEALLYCEQHSGTIDLLVTDVVMPQMSGPELAKRLAIERPGMRVMCMSGYTDDSVMRHGFQGPEIAYLQKPITPETLTRKVREVLDA